MPKPGRRMGAGRHRRVNSLPSLGLRGSRMHRRGTLRLRGRTRRAGKTGGCATENTQAFGDFPQTAPAYFVWRPDPLRMGSSKLTCSAK